MDEMDVLSLISGFRVDLGQGVHAGQADGEVIGAVRIAHRRRLLVHRPEELVDPLGEARRCRDEVPGSGATRRSARNSLARASQIRSSAGAWPPEATRAGTLASRRQSSAGRASPGRRPPCARQTHCNLRGKWPSLTPGAPAIRRKSRNIPSVRLEAMSQHSVTDQLEISDLDVAGNEVAERRLNQRQRPHARGRTRRCDERPQHTIGVRGQRAGGEDSSPTPCGSRARAAMNQQDLGTRSLTSHADEIHRADRTIARGKQRRRALWRLGVRRGAA